jgi:predicted DNA-binding transcriptional regulator AlpA
MTPDQIADAQHRQDRQLWAAVIMQALDDAAGKIEYYGGNKAAAERHKRLVRRRARDWFMHGGKDFKEVCALADMDPDWIRANALKKIEEAGEDGPTKRGRLITHKGERITLKELSARTGVSVAALYHRIKAGMTGDQLTAPSAERKPMEITHNGKSMTLAQWAEHLGMSKDALYSRIHTRGWSVEQALSTPVKSNASVEKKAA